MTTARKMSSIMILKEFFGYQPGKGLKDFAAEVKALSVEDKAELVKLAAVEMGAEVLDDKATMHP